jgi:eukaryotic-like serine/threonine-protein kinase
MHPGNPSGPGNDCPGQESLLAYAAGKLPSGLLDVVANHVAVCSACQSSLEEVPASTSDADPLVGKLRRCVGPLLTQAKDGAEKVTKAQEGSNEGALTVSERAGRRAPKPAHKLPCSFGQYELLEEIGQGGMGVVYKARQLRLNRIVAVKMIRAGSHASSGERERFAVEGEAVARLRHPNVIQVHEFNENDGQLFLCMEYLEGGTLDVKVDGKRLPLREAAQLVQTLANAVHVAHQQHIVHRDLKPANVLLAADGTPKISDFGLAKLLDAEGGQTAPDAVLGTPSYMAPEQAEGKAKEVGPQVDVYALGAILYQALTGRPPFKGATKMETLDQVRTLEPVPPTRLRREVPRDLEAICLKCLEKAPGDRYGSGGALAEDLERWLGALPTLARPLGRLGRGWRLVRRHAWGMATIVCLVVTGLLITAGAYYSSAERKRAAVEERLASRADVVIVGPRGEPAWSEWALGTGSITTAEEAEKVFTFSAFDPIVLLLVRNPQGPYRFSAEVRHRDDTGGGEVGLCFLYSRQTTPREVFHCYCTLGFNDFKSFQPGPDGKPLYATAVCAIHRSQGSDGDRLIPAGGKDYIPAALATPGVFPWRSLAVEVGPEGIQAFWEGEPFPRVSREELLEGFQSINTEIVDGPRSVPVFPDFKPSFTDRDGIGLYVKHAKASFRNVVVQPR